MKQKLKTETDEENDLLRDLSVVGCVVDSVYDFVNTNKSYSEAIPILINHLSKKYSYRVKEGIVRALAVKDAKGLANDILIKLYNQTPKDKSLFRWAIGNTVCVIINQDDIDDVLKIVTDKSNGISRQMFVLGLKKYRNFDKVKETLLSLIDDDDIKRQVLRSLK